MKKTEDDYRPEEFDALEVYVISLNGGAPVTDWTENKRDAETLFAPKGSDE